MSGGSKKPKKARLFVAVDPPERIRAALEGWQAANGAPELRPARPGALHFTLAFLGWLPERRLDEAAAVVSAASPRPVPVELAGEPRAIPSPKRARLYAFDADSPAMVELQAELSEALAAAELYEPEKRPFWPHMTVFRVKQQKRRPLRVKTPPGPLGGGVERAFGAVRLALYRSYLRPQGAEYVPIVDVELPQAGGSVKKQKDR